MAPSSPSLQLPPSPYESHCASGIIVPRSRSPPIYPSLPRTSYAAAAKKCVHQNPQYRQQQRQLRYHQVKHYNNSNNNNNYYYDQYHHHQRRNDYSDEEHQYLASDDEDENYDYERLKRYRNRLTSRRISPATINRLNLLVKRFLCFLACPSLRSSVRYSQDC